MVKYKAYFKKMIEENADAFRSFKKLHDQYKVDKSKFQDTYNSEGLKIRKIIEEWDRRLCSHMEAGNNSTYSARLSEKFWTEVRTFFRSSTSSV